MWLAQCFQSSKLIVSIKTPLMLGFLAPKSVLLGYLALYCRKTYHSETTHPQIGGGGSSPNVQSANAPQYATAPLG